MTKGEVDEEAFLPEQAPSVDVELWRGTAWCGEFGNYLFPAGLVACLCGSTKEDMATLCMCRIGCASDLANGCVEPISVCKLRACAGWCTVSRVGLVLATASRHDWEAKAEPDCDGEQSVGKGAYIVPTCGAEESAIFWATATFETLPEVLRLLGKSPWLLGKKHVF